MSCVDQNFLNCEAYISSLNKSNELKAAIKKAEEYLENLEIPEALKICSSEEDIPGFLSICDNLKGRNVVILGIGGSSLGGQAINDFATKYDTYINRKKYFHVEENIIKKKTRLFFFDNIDIDYLETILDIENPFIIAISKSGETTETLLQLNFLIDIINTNNFIILTEDKDSSLVRIAKAYKIPVLNHNPLIGGRFSLFSNVGLIPAILTGIDPYKFRKSASYALRDLKSDLIKSSAINFVLGKSGFNIAPVMIYSDRLQKFGDWFVQLWSESLGKNGYGTTPMTMLGTTFQHSILQLFLSGPNDKYFTVISENKNKNSSKSILGNILGDIMELNDESIVMKSFLDKSSPREFHNISPSLKYLQNKTMDTVFHAEKQAVIRALIEESRPIRHIEISLSAPDQIGELFAYFMLETILTAKLFGIDPYTQDSVEKVKILTKQILSK